MDTCVLTVKKIRKTDVSSLRSVSDILFKCGKDMALKQGLHHWDNSRLKTLVIVALGVIKNDVYLVSLNKEPVATFQTKKRDSVLCFEKLATIPEKAGIGVGSYCMERIEGIAREKGCKKIAMEVYGASRHAKEFYEHKGYKSIGTDKTLKYQVVLMERNINT